MRPWISIISSRSLVSTPSTRQDGEISSFKFSMMPYERPSPVRTAFSILAWWATEEYFPICLPISRPVPVMSITTIVMIDPNQRIKYLCMIVDSGFCPSSFLIQPIILSILYFKETLVQGGSITFPTQRIILASCSPWMRPLSSTFWSNPSPECSSRTCETHVLSIFALEMSFSEQIKKNCQSTSEPIDFVLQWLPMRHVCQSALKKLLNELWILPVRIQTCHSIWQPIQQALRPTFARNIPIGNTFPPAIRQSWNESSISTTLPSSTRQLVMLYSPRHSPPFGLFWQIGLLSSWQSEWRGWEHRPLVRRRSCNFVWQANIASRTWLDRVPWRESARHSCRSEYSCARESVQDSTSLSMLPGLQSEDIAPRRTRVSNGVICDSESTILPA